MRITKLLIGIFTALLFLSQPSYAWIQDAIVPNPALQETQWEFDVQDAVSFTDPNGNDITWRFSTYYHNSAGTYLYATHTIFGKLVIKAYGILGPDKKTVVTSFVQLEKDGIWYTAEHGDISVVLVSDKTGKVTSATVILVDKNEIPQVIRNIERPADDDPDSE